MVHKIEPDFKEALELTLRLLGTPAKTWNSTLYALKSMVHHMVFAQNPTYSFKDGFGTPNLSLPFHITDHVDTVKDDLVDPRGVYSKCRRGCENC